jgi:hypothetical protein
MLQEWTECGHRLWVMREDLTEIASTLINPKS